MLSGGNSGRPGLLFAPTFEVPHARPLSKQASVRFVCRYHSYHDSIVI
jgi:hypothetical protein